MKQFHKVSIADKKLKKDECAYCHKGNWKEDYHALENKDRMDFKEDFSKEVMSFLVGATLTFCLEIFYFFIIFFIFEESCEVILEGMGCLTSTSFHLNSHSTQRSIIIINSTDKVFFIVE